MKKSLMILAIISSIVSVGTSLSQYYSFTFIPVIISLILGGIVYYRGRHHQYPKKSIQMIFLVAIIAVSIAIFKSINTPDPIVDQENLESKE